VERLLAEVDPAPSSAGDWRAGLDAFAREELFTFGLETLLDDLEARLRRSRPA